MSLYTPQDRVIGLQLLNAYTAGSGSFTLKSGQGSQIAGPFPARATVIRASTYSQGSAEVSTIYGVTAVTGDVVTVSGAIDGTTDQNFSPGDYFELRSCAGYIKDLNTLVNTNTTGIASNSASITTLNGEVAANSASITTLNGEVAANSASITTLNGEVAANSASITTLNGEVAANSASITTLNGEVAPLTATQSANTVLAGPTSASPAATPSFRRLVVGDLPATSLCTGYTNTSTIHHVHRVVRDSGRRDQYSDHRHRRRRRRWQRLRKYGIRKRLWRWRRCGWRVPRHHLPGVRTGIPALDQYHQARHRQ